MKWILLIISIAVCLTIENITYKTKLVESKIIHMYENNFDKYILIEENLKVNLKEIKKDLEKLNCKVSECDGDVCFVVVYNSLFKASKKYLFLLEKKDE